MQTSETVSFVQTMKRLAEKAQGVDTTPDHRERIMDVDIVMVAQSDN